MLTVCRSRLRVTANRADLKQRAVEETKAGKEDKRLNCQGFQHWDGRAAPTEKVAFCKDLEGSGDSSRIAILQSMSPKLHPLLY